MIFAHVMGVPVEESALALAPAGAAILSGGAVIARSKLAGIVGWVRRRCDGEPIACDRQSSIRRRRRDRF